MIQPWLGDVHEALHNSKDLVRVAINGKIREIKSLSGGLRSMVVGGFTFIMQNPEKDTMWGKFAREGKMVTQVKMGNKWFGVIVNHEVLKYQSHGKDPIVIGDLVTDRTPDNDICDICAKGAAEEDDDLIQPSPEIRAAVPKVSLPDLFPGPLGGVKPKPMPDEAPAWIKKAVNPPPLPVDERIKSLSGSDKEPDLHSREGIVDFIKVLLHGLRTGQIDDAKKEIVEEFLGDAIEVYINSLSN